MWLDPRKVSAPWPPAHRPSSLPAASTQGLSPEPQHLTEGEMEREATWHLTQSSLSKGLWTSPLPRAAASHLLPLPPKPPSFQRQDSYLLLHHPLTPSLSSYCPLLPSVGGVWGWALSILLTVGRPQSIPKPRTVLDAGCMVGASVEMLSLVGALFPGTESEALGKC